MTPTHVSRSLEARAGRSSLRRARVLTALLGLVAALAATLFVAPSPASAHVSYAVKYVPRRTSAELSMMRSLEREINRERAAHHLRPVYWSPQLGLSARRHDIAMSRANAMSHQLPGEAFFARRISAAGYRWSWAGENIGWNSRMSTAGVIQLERMMYNEKAPYDGHRVNILSRHFTNVGMDVYLDHRHHKVWITTDFGRH